MDLKEIKGLGAKRIETLNQKNIYSAESLALYFPKTYFDLNTKDTFEEDGKNKLIKAVVCEPIKMARIRKDFNYSYCTCTDLNGNKFKAVWYNQPYLSNAINVGDTLFLYGKNSNTKKGFFTVSTYKNANKIKEGTQFLPVYKNIKNIGQTILNQVITTAISACDFDSVIPDKIEKNNYNFSLKDAISTLHNPENLDNLNKAKQRLDIEKILPFIHLSEIIKQKKQQQKTHFYSNISTIFEHFCTFLPYKLTKSQQDVMTEIIQDFNSNKVMNRIVQGDVGSGKTIVALAAASICVQNGYTAFLVAPTEILAKQHFQEAKKYFDKLNLNVEFISSKTTLSQRKELINRLQTIPTLLIGTQSCLNEQINTPLLSLVIIDEQHRFGVKQRSQLVNKSLDTDLLMLSATPIPRTLSLVYYGELDVSIMKNPPNEKHIQTNIVNQNKEAEMWTFIKNKIETSNSKVYVVCANIDSLDDDSYQNLSVKETYSYLCDILGKQNVVMAHGKLSSEQENKIINQFKNGEAKVLVSTTIIEVGIDIKDADIIVIVSPEKHGLATLHQLRGRVGRQGQQSYCFCLSKNFNELSYERIKYFKQNNNGFDIAEFDYQNRGAGDILSTKQHGQIDNIFDYVSLATFNKAKEIYNQIIKSNLSLNIKDAEAYEQISNISNN